LPKVVYVNDSFCRLSGYDRADIQGQPLAPLLGTQTRPKELAQLAAALAEGRVHRGENVLYRRDGVTFVAEREVLPVRNRRSEVIYWLFIYRDVTARRESQQALAYQALHDNLTGLPNRMLLVDRLNHALRGAKRQAVCVAFLLLDLDNFKEINDGFGHHVGDKLLQGIAARLSDAIRHGDTIARLGGDEFGFVLPGAEESEASRLAARLLGHLEEPFSIEEHAFEIAASVGIALYPQHGEDADTLMRRADMAMYHAKAHVLRQSVFAADVEEESAGRVSLLRDLREALERKQLHLLYQPKLCLTTRRALGVEALLRWNHPRLGLLTPDQFIPLAEQTGLIRPLTIWVVEEAVQQVTTWEAAGCILDVAVNLSMRNMLDPELFDHIQEVLERHQLDSSRLVLELTETTVMSDPAHQLQLSRLRHLGLQLSIDDFGTGYSSLAYLRQLPVSEIKIDKSFVRGLGGGDNDDVIVRCIIELAHQLGLNVVAEGVETEVALNQLIALGCDVAQGYHLGHPMPASDLLTWWQAYHSKPA
jgi:diguanylate cyclase (GGDEF)-like protein/PAS domain S-box-containing protein